MLLVSVDGLRADVIGTGAMPTLDALAEGSDLQVLAISEDHPEAERNVERLKRLRRAERSYAGRRFDHRLEHNRLDACRPGEVRSTGSLDNEFCHNNDEWSLRRDASARAADAIVSLMQKRNTGYK
mgnify:CR=1 FL=1